MSSKPVGPMNLLDAAVEPISNGWRSPSDDHFAMCLRTESGQSHAAANGPGRSIWTVYQYNPSPYCSPGLPKKGELEF